jgi:hypothetical protein
VSVPSVPGVPSGERGFLAKGWMSMGRKWRSLVVTPIRSSENRPSSLTLFLGRRFFPVISCAYFLRKEWKPKLGSTRFAAFVEGDPCGCLTFSLAVAGCP